MFKAVQNSLLSIIYPQECRVCSGPVENREDGIACAECWAATRMFDGHEMLCRKCGAFLGERSPATPVTCHQCDDHHYDEASALGVYEKALAASIIFLKADPFIPRRIKTALPTVLSRDSIANVDVIAPIPLSKKRTLERGFNQADVVARLIAGSTGVHIDNASLSRKLHTSIHRIGMDRRARDLTMVNAFEVARPKLIEGKNILLVDDVFTSGATASACAGVLKKNGASRVNVFTLARAVMR